MNENEIMGLTSQEIQTRPETSPQVIISDKNKYKKKKDIEEDLLKRKDDKSILDNDKKKLIKKRIVNKWESIYNK
jgi:hypothetical protein